MPASLVYPNPANQNLFEVVLSDDATAVEKALKERFDKLRGRILEKDIRGADDLLKRLSAAERLALVGVDGQPDPSSALVSFGAILAEVERLMLPAGRFEVRLPTKEPPLSERDIVFELKKDGRSEPVPAEQLTLKGDIENTLTILQVIFPEPDGRTSTIRDALFGHRDASVPTRPIGKPETTMQGPDVPAAGTEGTAASRSPAQRRYCEYQLKLKSLAEVGLEGDASPDTARLALIALQNEIVQREGPRIKNTYMWRLAIWAAIFGGLTAVAYLVIRNNDAFSEQLTDLKNLFLMWTGTMIGTWLSFGIRKPVIGIRDLGALESDMVEPPLRLLFTGLVATTFAFIFITRMVNVTVGGLDSTALLHHGTTALVIGLLFGVSEQALPGALTRRASQFVAEVAGR